MLYFDIETAPEFPVLKDAPKHVQDYFEKKYLKENDTEVDPSRNLQSYYEKNCALMAEFSRVVCVSFAYQEPASTAFKFQSFCYEDESQLLWSAFAVFAKSRLPLCGHNIVGFDLPFLCKRFLKYGIKLPPIFELLKKPWEQSNVDTMLLAKFGNFSGAVSLDNLCYLLGIPSPKHDMDGSQVASVFYSKAEDKYDRIKKYCEGDVAALILVADKLLQQFKLGTEITITNQTELL